MALCWTHSSISMSLSNCGAQPWRAWPQALSFGHHPHCPSGNDQRRQNPELCVPALCSDSQTMLSSQAWRWFPSLASLPCCSESLVGMIIRSWEVDESLSCRAVQFCVECCADLPTHLGWRFIYGALRSDTVISFPSPHSHGCLLTMRFLSFFFFSSSLCVK